MGQPSSIAIEFSLGSPPPRSSVITALAAYIIVEPSLRELARWQLTLQEGFIDPLFLILLGV